VLRNNALRETDTPTPPPTVDSHHHNGNGVEGSDLKTKLMNNTDHCHPIKTEGIATR